MHVHINHCCCTKSNWTGDTYWCRYMVVIERSLSKDPWAEDDKDWGLIEESDFHDQKRYESYKGSEFFKGRSDEELRIVSKTTTMRLRPEVFEWLDKNVENIKENGRRGEKGWCVGNDSYNSHDRDFTIFFHRRSDAMKFIKCWSQYGKPTTYFDYFKGIRRQLDFKTKTLKAVHSFSPIA